MAEQFSATGGSYRDMGSVEGCRFADLPREVDRRFFDVIVVTESGQRQKRQVAELFKAIERLNRRN